MSTLERETAALDRAWRRGVWLTLGGILVVTGLLAFVVLPLVGGKETGLDAFTAICRAFGIGTGKSAPPPFANTTPQTRVAWTAPEFAILASGNKAAGAELAQGTCVACHAIDGTSPDPTIPRMAGQSPFAQFKELQDFKSGARANETMAPLAKALDDKQMADVATYYASLAAPASAAHPSFAGPEIEALVQRGDSARALPPCASCHGANTGGPFESPAIAAQSPAYVIAQLQAFAGGTRHNDIFARMRTIAGKLTPREIELLGDYYATQH
jgi:cytochrome c553